MSGKMPCVCLAVQIVIQQNHKILWVGRTFKGCLVQPLAMSRDIFSYIRLLRFDVTTSGTTAKPISLSHSLIPRVDGGVCGMKTPFVEGKS